MKTRTLDSIFNNRPAEQIHLCRPECVVLGGMVAKHGGVLQQAIEDYIAEECFGGAQTRIPTISFATLGDQAGLIGAANLI